MVTGWPGVYDHPSGRHGFACPVHNCYYRIGLRPGDTTDHKCPRVGETKVSWSVAKTLLETVWDQFDGTIDAIKTPDPLLDQMALENLKGQARAYSRMLAVFMVPQFTSEEEIAREGMKRWKMRQAGEEYDTPGLGARRYEGPPAKQGVSTTPDASRHIPGRKPLVAHKLTPGELTQLKNAHASGMFDIPDLAHIYKLSEETVTAILAD